MVKGINAYQDKERRKRRRENHIAKDLIGNKYRQRRIENKKDKYNFEYGPE